MMKNQGVALLMVTALLSACSDSAAPTALPAATADVSIPCVDQVEAAQSGIWGSVLEMALDDLERQFFEAWFADVPLTPGQESRIRLETRRYAEQFEAALRCPDTAPADADLMETYLQRLAQVLTDDQFAQVEANIAAQGG